MRSFLKSSRRESNVNFCIDKIVAFGIVDSTISIKPSLSKGLDTNQVRRTGCN
jgi:hypothetical protein